MFKNLLYIYSKIEQTYIQKIEQYNNTNNSTNNGVREQTQGVLLEEKQKNKIYSDPDNALLTFKQSIYFVSKTQLNEIKPS